MDCLYTTSNQSAILIYPNANYIFLRHKNNEQIGRPSILAKDYKGNFCSVVYQKNLYYCYQTTDERIVLKSIQQAEPYYQGDCGTDAVLTDLKLVAFQNQLILFYGKLDQRTNDYHLNCLFPLKQDITITQIVSLQNKPDFQSIQTPFHILLHLSSNQTQLTYLMDQNFDFTELINQQTYQTITQYEQATQRRNWDLKAQDYQQSIERKDALIQRQQQMIESAKAQYEELMHVAEKYREEALKWRGKFI